MKKWLAGIGAAALSLWLVYVVGSGFLPCSNVFLINYTVPPGKGEMTIHVGVASSIGYTRAVRNVSRSPDVLELEFYSAFGGINGSWGARHIFVIPVPEQCREIRFLRAEGTVPVLVKDVAGAWVTA